MRNWTDTTVDRVSRVAAVYSITPEFSYVSVILLRIAWVLRSIASATTLGEGGRGTLDANERFDKAETRGVRASARDRVVAASDSESSLKSSQQSCEG